MNEIILFEILEYILRTMALFGIIAFGVVMWALLSGEAE